MARSVTSQLMAAYYESQRKAQRAQAAQARQRRAIVQEQLRAQRAAERAQAQYDRAALLGYQRHREDDAASRTQQLSAKLDELESILSRSVTVPAFQLSRCRALFTAPRFNPGPLATPVQQPDPARYQVPAPSGILARTPKSRQQFDAAVAQAKALFEEHWRIAAQTEAERQVKLTAYYNEFQSWVEGESRRVKAHNSALDDLAVRYAAVDPEGVLQYFSAVVSSQVWPDEFPHERRAAWDASARQLVINWQLPTVDIVPAVGRYRYIKATDLEKEVERPASERRAIYRRVLAQSALRIVSDLFRADAAHCLSSVAFNGYARDIDPATGRMAAFHLVAVTVSPDAMSGVNLGRAEPISCLEGLRARLSAKPDQLQCVQPGRLPRDVQGLQDFQADDAAPTDLHALDPLVFEDLVADLFRRMNFQVMTTARSGDEGVDVLAIDPDPVRGGKIVIQVKRYKATISPAVVRELYGTVIAQGAAKGILVTTSKFGPGSREFADNKPLSLIDGSTLASLLAQHGLSGVAG